ncbi:MAG: P-loop NTPase [Candidatus Aenigmatarchaeota archaeon]
MSRVIGILSGKGGVGKTTITAILSSALSLKFNKKVTVIDCNMTTSHLGMHFGIFFYPKTFNDFLKGNAEIKDVVFPHGTGVNIIPASLNLSDLVGIDMAHIKEKLEDALSNDDFVFLDIAPGFGKEAVSAMKACQEAILVTTPDLPSVTDAIKAKAVLDQMKINTIGLVINKISGKKFELKKEEIMQMMNLPIIAEIPFSFDFVESLSNKTPLVVYKNNSDASVEIFKLASYISGEIYKPKINLIKMIVKMFKP